LILLAAAAATAAYLAHRHGYLANKGHRVQRNQKAVVKVTGPMAWGRYKGEDRKIRAFLKSMGSAVRESDGGSGVDGWDASYEVSMSRVDPIVSKLRQKFRKEIKAGKVQIRVDRNVRGSAPERGNRGRRR